MFCNLVNAYINYDNTQSLMALKLIDTIKNDIQYDLHEAISQSGPLVKKHTDLFNTSTTFLHFLTRLFKIDFVGKTSVNKNMMRETTTSFNDEEISPQKNEEDLNNKLEEMRNIYTQLEEDNRKLKDKNMRLEKDLKICNENKNTRLETDLKICNEDKVQLEQKLKNIEEKNTQLGKDLKICNEDKVQLKQNLKNIEEKCEQLEKDLKICNEYKVQLEQNLKICNDEYKTEQTLTITDMAEDVLTPHSENLNEPRDIEKQLRQKNRNLYKEINQLKCRQMFLTNQSFEHLTLYQKTTEELNRLKIEYNSLSRALVVKQNDSANTIQQMQYTFDFEVIRIKQMYMTEISNWKNAVGFILDFTRVLPFFEELDINLLNPNIQSYFQNMKDLLMKFKEHYKNIFMKYGIPISTPIPLEIEEVEAIAVDSSQQQQQSTNMTIEEISNNLFLTWKEQESIFELRKQYEELQQEKRNIENRYFIKEKQLISQHNTYIENLINNHEDMIGKLTRRIKELSSSNNILSTTNNELQEELQTYQNRVKDFEDRIEKQKHENIFSIASDVITTLKDKVENSINDKIIELYNNLCSKLEKPLSHDENLDFMLDFIDQTLMNYVIKFKKMRDVLKSVVIVHHSTTEDDTDIKFDRLIEYYNAMRTLLQKSYIELNTNLAHFNSLDKDVELSDKNFSLLISNVITHCNKLANQFKITIYTLQEYLSIQSRKLSSSLSYKKLFSEMDKVMFKIKNKLPEPKKLKSQNKYKRRLLSFNEEKEEEEEDSDKEKDIIECESTPVIITINRLLIVKYFEIFYDYVIQKNKEPENLYTLYNKLESVESCEDYKSFIMAQISIIDSLSNNKKKLDNTFYGLFPEINPKILKFFDEAKDIIVNYIKEYAIRKPDSSLIQPSTSGQS